MDARAVAGADLPRRRALPRMRGGTAPASIASRPKSSATHQPSKDRQIAAVERIDVAAAPALCGVQFGRLEQHRQPAKPPIGEDPPERLEPEVAFADVLVPIDAAAARLLGVVQMKRLQSREADGRAELPGTSPGSPLPSRCRIPRSADGTCRGTRRRAASRQHVDDRREMLEPMTEVRALPRGVLEQSSVRPSGRDARLRESLGDEAQPVRFRPVVNDPGCMTSPSRPSVSARSSSSRSASIDFRAQRLVGGGHIDQVAVVRDDGMDPGVLYTRRNSAISSSGSSRARHWPADFVKICRASQPLAAARSTARGSPPAIDRWAPSRGTGRS